MAQSGLMTAILLAGYINTGSWHSTATTLAAILLFSIAATCGIMGTLSLKSSLTPFPAARRSSRLVRHGIYRFMRHPLYTGVMAAAAGWATWRGSLLALAITALLGWFFDDKSRAEERWLCQVFPDYPDYARKVRRFIPGLY